MTNDELLDLYSDYLISAFGQTTSTGLAAVLNGVGNIEFKESDFYSAAEDARFDLIVANPPYDISPEAEFQFRDGGLGADRVAEHVARNGPRFLNEGGYLQMVCAWAN